MTTNVYGALLFMVANVLLFWIIYAIAVKTCGQKTRNPQQRRMYAGSRARPSLTTHEPTIYVSPSNLPPPPKYECMAPPSYEEVVGVHYPNQQAQQPIAHPITTALAQSNNTNTRTVEPLPATDDAPPPATNQGAAPASLTAVNERQS